MICELFTIIAIASLIISAASAGVSYYQKEETQKQMAKSEANQQKLIKEDKNLAKAQAVRQFNVAWANMRSSELLARRDEILEKRKQSYDGERFNGKPVEEENVGIG